MKEYQYTKINIDKIKPYDKNARTHSTKQVEQIMNSIKTYGFTNPLLIDENNNLIAGHGRLEAVKQLNRVEFKNNPLLELPAIIIEGLSEADKKALIIADNQIALNAGWDYEILSEELNELANISYDLDLLAFDNIDDLLDYEPEIDESEKELKEVEINQKYELLIKCKNESELERAYNENIERGYECKVLTF
jgi:site-specific DNA-methyltransferase (adenine-specific)